MAKVTGIGGVFFRARDPEALRACYRTHLGIESEAWGAVFRWADDPNQAAAYTIWAPFAADTDYFGSRDQSFMINFRVDDLDGLLASLRAAGVEVDNKLEESDFGRFGWCVDPEGTRIELWEPPPKAPGE